MIQFITKPCSDVGSDRSPRLSWLFTVSVDKSLPPYHFAAPCPSGTTPMVSEPIPCGYVPIITSHLRTPEHQFLFRAKSHTIDKTPLSYR